jgi:hypothetical protein
MTQYMACGAVHVRSLASRSGRAGRLEHDFVFTAFGNDGRAMPLHDQLILWLLREQLNEWVPELVSEATPVSDLSPYAGTYRSNHAGRRQRRGRSTRREGGLRTDGRDTGSDLHRVGFAGGSVAAPPRRFVPVRQDLASASSSRSGSVRCLAHRRTRCLVLGLALAALVGR